MNKSTALIALSIVGLPLSGLASSVLVPLQVDVTSSTASPHNGSVLGILTDTFSYDIDNPTAVLPAQAWGSNGNGWHATDSNSNLSVEFTGGDVTLGAGQTFFIDIYGRSDGCCTARDDSFPIALMSNSTGDGVLGTVAHSDTTGIPGGAAPHHVRYTYSGGATFDGFNLPGPHNSGIVFMEVRAGIETIPEPSSTTLGLFGVAVLLIRRRR